MTAKVIRMRYTRNGVEQFAGIIPITLPDGAYLGDLQSDLSYMCRTATQGGRSLSLVIEDAPTPAEVINAIEKAVEEVDQTIPSTVAANGKAAKPPAAKKKAADKAPVAKTQKKLDKAVAADKAKATKAKAKKATKQKDLDLDCNGG